MEVVIVALAATLGNLLMGWDSSTIAGLHFFFICDYVVSSDFSVLHTYVSLKF